MAETLTYDPGADTVTEGDNLTPEEQDSLQVGESLQQQENELLAGKYKDAQELEKAYAELEKKLGEREEPDKPEAEKQEEEVEEESESEPSPAVSLITEASTEYYANEGQIKPETLEKFSSMSSQDLVNAYMEIQKTNPQQQQQEEVNVSESDINSIQNSVGGKKPYSDLVKWAGSNLDSKSVEAFDDVVSTGNVQMIKLAVTGLKAQYDNANGYEGRMLTGKSAKTSGDVFRSQASLVEAMSDPRYDRDPAYRQDVIEKLDRSDLSF